MSHVRVPVAPVEPHLAELRALGARPHEMLRAAIDHAVLAPSSHNTQPWRFRLRDDSVDVMADRTRALPIVDPADRELTISCGAALLHLRLALRAMGCQAPFELLPEGSASDVLARVRVGERVAPSALELRLIDAMFARRTHRRRFMEWPVSPTLLGLLADDAQEEGAWLATIESADARNALADVVALADRMQWEDPLFRAELAEWLRPNHSKRRDGMPGYAHDLHEAASMAAPSIVRTFDLGEGLAATDRTLLLEGSPVLLCLGTQHDGVRDWLVAGQALARVWLHATVEGVSASFLNQAIEVPSTRARLPTIVDHAGSAQMILRMGYGYPVRGTPRRDVSEVLVEGDA